MQEIIIRPTDPAELGTIAVPDITGARQPLVGLKVANESHLVTMLMTFKQAAMLHAAMGDLLEDLRSGGAPQ
ncbi:MAG: hypothetical protein DCC73_14910 [Proteobacteria bacterium]|nr:MAG: hypothetical protein DCC73_14910 [Pseudomonadota bacterium]